MLTSQQAAGYFLSLKLRLSHQGAEYALSLSNQLLQSHEQPACLQKHEIHDSEQVVLQLIFSV